MLIRYYTFSPDDFDFDYNLLIIRVMGQFSPYFLHVISDHMNLQDQLQQPQPSAHSVSDTAVAHL